MDYKMNIEDYIICPITKQIFLQPVIANDGITYEKQVLEKWLTKQKTSPVNKTIVIKNYYESLTIKNIIDIYLEIHPEKKPEQYVKLVTAQEIADEIMKHRPHTYLLDTYKIKRMIDECIDLEYVFEHKITDYDSDNEATPKLIHIVCQYASSEIIQYLIDKGVDLECEDDENHWTPLHYLCDSSTPENIRYIIKKGADTNKLTQGLEDTILHLIAKNFAINITDKIAFINELLQYDEIKECNNITNDDGEKWWQCIANR